MTVVWNSCYAVFFGGIVLSGSWTLTLSALGYLAANFVVSIQFMASNTIPKRFAAFFLWALITIGGWFLTSRSVAGPDSKVYHTIGQLVWQDMIILVSAMILLAAFGVVLTLRPAAPHTSNERIL